jgi:hypothetical protein
MVPDHYLTFGSFPTPIVSRFHLPLNQDNSYYVLFNHRDQVGRHCFLLWTSVVVNNFILLRTKQWTLFFIWGQDGGQLTFSPQWNKGVVIPITGTNEAIIF